MTSLWLFTFAFASILIQGNALTCNKFARVMLGNVSDVKDKMLKRVDSPQANFCTKMVFYCSMGNYAVIYGSGAFEDETACFEAGIARFKKELYKMYYKKYDPKQGEILMNYCFKSDSCNTFKDSPDMLHSFNSTKASGGDKGDNYECDGKRSFTGALLKDSFKIAAPKACLLTEAACKRQACQGACDSTPGCNGYTFSGSGSSKCSLYKQVDAGWGSASKASASSGARSCKRKA